MKKTLLLFFLCIFTYTQNFAIVAPKGSAETEIQSGEKDLSAKETKALQKLRKAQKKQDKKMGWFKKWKMERAMKSIEKRPQGGSLPKGVYILLSIIGLGWLAMGILDGFTGNNWWIALILYLLAWLPGFIFAMIKLGEYY